jgi:hypothetical protein
MAMHKSRIGFGLLVGAGMILLANNALAGGGGVPSVPDGGSSALMMTVAMSALMFGRRLLR